MTQQTLPTDRTRTSSSSSSHYADAPSTNGFVGRPVGSRAFPAAIEIAAEAGAFVERAGTAGEPGSMLRIESVSKSFGSQAVLDATTLDVGRGEFVALLGPSGCGKTTLLRIVAGLERQDSGRVLIDGADVSALPASRRGCGVVFQSYALFPNLTAARNVGFGVNRRRYDRRARRERVAELLALVGLSSAGDRYPAQLSGGQQQRVALARALAAEPSVLLLDEPLSALDVKIRSRLRAELRRLQQALGLTTVLVTHDQEEALTTADRVAVMRRGRVEQTGTPREIYQRPASTYVADFVGAMNLLPGWTAGHDGGLRRGGFTLKTDDRVEPGARVSVGFRPESGILLASNNSTSVDRWTPSDLPVRLERIEFRGASCRAHLTLDVPFGSNAIPASPTALVVDLPSHEALRIEDGLTGPLRLRLAPGTVRAFATREGDGS